MQISLCYIFTLRAASLSWSFSNASRKSGNLQDHKYLWWVKRQSMCTSFLGNNQNKGTILVCINWKEATEDHWSSFFVSRQWLFCSSTVVRYCVPYSSICNWSNWSWKVSYLNGKSSRSFWINIDSPIAFKGSYEK